MEEEFETPFENDITENGKVAEKMTPQNPKDDDDDETVEQFRQIFTVVDESCPTCEKREKWLDWVNVCWNVLTLLLEILDMVTDTMLYFHIAKMMPPDAAGFSVAYLVVLILSFFFSFLPEVALTVIEIVGATCDPDVMNLLDHKRAITVSKIFSLLVEDFGISLVLLLTLLRSGVCAYVVSLTYTKSAVLSCIFTILAAWGKSVGLLIANRRTLWSKKSSGENRRTEEPVFKPGGQKSSSWTLYYFIYVICILFAPLSVSLFVGGNLLYALITGYYSRVYERFSHVMFHRLLVWWLVLNLPTFLSVINLIYMFNVDSLAALTTCDNFIVKIGLTGRYPVHSCSNGNDSESWCNVTLESLTTVEIRGSSFIVANRAVVEKPCRDMFAPSVGLSPMILGQFINSGTNACGIEPEIQCTFFTVISYSTSDFHPEFNIAFQIENDDYSTCVKPMIRNPGIKTSWFSTETLQIAGKNFCNHEINNFTVLFKPCTSSTPELIANGVPCFDCEKFCYNWPSNDFNDNSRKRLSSNNEIQFVGFSKTGDKTTRLRYNPHLATPCDVDLDWKIHKYFCL